MGAECGHRQLHDGIGRLMPEAGHAGVVLEQAGRRAAAWLGLDDALVTDLLGTESRHLSDGISPTSQEGQNALALIDVARRLERLCGSQEAAGVWLRGTHLRFSRPPVDILREANGLDLIRGYLSGFEP